MRIIGPRPVERNGLRGFVTTFEFGNTHSPDLSSHQVNSPASPPSPEPGTPSPETATRRLDDLGSVQDGLKMSRDGQDAGVLKRPDGERLPVSGVTVGETTPHSHASRNGEG